MIGYPCVWKKRVGKQIWATLSAVMAARALTIARFMFVLADTGKRSRYVALLLCVGVFSMAPQLSGAAPASTDSVSFASETAVVGESVTVSFSKAEATQAWIGIYTADAADRSYGDYAYTGRATTGSRTFTFDTPGTYEARLFSGSGYERLTVSEPITVNSDSAEDDPDDPGTPPPSDFTVSVTNDTYAPDTPVTISYEKPGDDRAWVGLFAPAASDRSYEEWDYVDADEQSGSITLDGLAAGTYEARFFTGGGYDRVAVSDTFTVASSDDDGDGDDGGGGGGEPGDYDVSVPAGPYTPGDTLTASFTLPGAAAEMRHWAGLYTAGSDDREYVDWDYLSRNVTTGTVTFTAGDPGEYEVRLFRSSGYDEVAVTDAITVSGTEDDDPDDPDDPGTPPPSDFTVSVTNDTYAPDTPVTISYEKPGDDRAWVGLFAPAASDRSYEEWDYVDADEQSGSITLDGLAAGTYEARFFTGGGYDRVAVSDTFTVASSEDDGDGDDDDGGDGGDGSGDYALTLSATEVAAGSAVTVEWNTPASADRERDWIGVYAVGASNRSYEDWNYTNEAASGSLTFTLDTPGTYEFRYLTNNSYTDVATSPSVVVTGESGSDGALTCPVSDPTQFANIPPPDGPIVAFGDSLTAGVGATAGQDVVSELERRLGESIINEGVSGDTTEDALARLESDVLARDPSVVIVWLGGNDILGRLVARVEAGVDNLSFDQLRMYLQMQIADELPEPSDITEDETFANLTTIIERIQATGAATVVVGVSGGPYEETLEARYASVAAATDSLYVPDALDNVFGRPGRMADLVHPNNTGYDIVASRIAPYVSCTLE